MDEQINVIENNVSTFATAEVIIINVMLLMMMMIMVLMFNSWLVILGTKRELISLTPILDWSFLLTFLKI